MSEQSDRPLFSPKALAEYLGVSERTVRSLLAGPEPRIPSRVIGPRLRRVRPEDVDRYLAECESRDSVGE